MFALPKRMPLLVPNRMLISAVIVIAIGLCAALAGCGTTVPASGTPAAAATPAQQYYQAATVTVRMVDDVALAADAAVNAHLLKGQDAKNVKVILDAASAGLNDAAKVANTDPGDALTKVTAIAAGLAGANAIITLASPPKPPAPAASGVSK